MIYTIVAGENASQLCSGLAGILGKLCHLVVADGNALWADDHQAELLLWRGKGDLSVRTPASILVFGQPSRLAERIEVPDNCVVVAALEDEAAAGFAARRGLRLLDCGLSSKASLTFSSIGRENGVISLQRSITDLAGQTVEPQELPLGIPPKPHYPLLASVGVLLLAGLSRRLEEKPCAKIW